MMWWRLTLIIIYKCYMSCDELNLSNTVGENQITRHSSESCMTHVQRQSRTESESYVVDGWGSMKTVAEETVEQKAALYNLLVYVGYDGIICTTNR